MYAIDHTMDNGLFAWSESVTRNGRELSGT